MKGLNQLEQAVLDKLLQGDHPGLAALRIQAKSARLARREYTGVGFCCDFEIPADVPLLDGDSEIGDVSGDLEGVAHGAGFVLFIRDGALACLEGFTYDEPWPETIKSFTLNYEPALGAGPSSFWRPKPPWDTPMPEGRGTVKFREAKR